MLFIVFLFQVVLSLLLCEIYVPVNVIVSLNSSRRMLRTWRTPSSPYNTVGLRRNKFENGTNHPAMHRLLIGLCIRYSDVTESMLTTAFDRHFVGITRHSKERKCADTIGTVLVS